MSKPRVDLPRKPSRGIFVGDKEHVLGLIKEHFGESSRIVEVNPPKQGKFGFIQGWRRNWRLKLMENKAVRLNRGDVLFIGNLMEWTKPDVEGTSFGIRPGMLLEFLDCHITRADISICGFVSEDEREQIPAVFYRPGRLCNIYN